MAMSSAVTWHFSSLFEVSNTQSHVLYVPSAVILLVLMHAAAATNTTFDGHWQK